MWRLQTALLASSAFTVALIDFFEEHSLTWSQEPLISIFFSWVIITLFIRKRSRPVRALPGIFLVLTLFLLTLDGLDGHLSWAPSIALPIAAGGIALAYLLLKRWPPLPGKRAAFCAKAIVAVNIETLLIDLLTGAGLISWSGIVIIASIPLIVFLLFYHHERSRWERFLRI